MGDIMLRRNLFLLLGSAIISGACGPDASKPVAPSAQAPDAQAAPTFWDSGASVYWNSVARNLVVKYSSSPFAAIRGYALLSHAQYLSTVQAEDANGNVKPSTTAAVASASVGVLTYLYPAEAAALGALKSSELSAQGWPGDAKTDQAAGEAIGNAVAQQIVADARTDRFFAPWTGTVPTGPGIWFSSLVPPAPPVGAMFGQARTYYLTSGDQFRPCLLYTSPSPRDS